MMLLYPLIVVASFCLLLTMLAGAMLKVKSFVALLLFDFVLTFVVLTAVSLATTPDGGGRTALAMSLGIAATVAGIGFVGRYVVRKVEPRRRRELLAVEGAR